MAETLRLLNLLEEPPSEQRVNILLVDDEPANLLVLEAILSDLPANLVKARSGEEALSHLREVEFAAVLLDVRMHGLDGYETAKLIRNQEKSRPTPIIFITAYDDALRVEEAYALGAVDYLVKPLVPLILRAKVAGFVELFEKTEQVRRQAEQLRRMEHREFSRRLAEENARLQESERRFRTLASHAPVGIFQTDAEGNCLFVNDRWCLMAGLSPEEAQGRGWVGALHPQDRERIFQEWYDTTRAGREFASEYRFQTPHGKMTWLHGSAIALRNNAGKVTGYLGTVMDITERKQAEEALRESERVYRAIGESIDYGVWVCDPQGRNTYASESFLRLVGLTQEQCSSFGWGAVLHPDDAERTIAAWKECVRTGERWDVEHRFRGVDGRWHPVLARGVPVRNEGGEIVAWAGINLDISRLKRVEDELREAHRRKDEFLATLAHELRNPLAPIRNSLHILNMPGLDAATAERSRELMERQIQHLVRLVDDLLDVSRVMRGKIELRKERVALASVIARAVETAQPLIEAQGHELTIRLPPESLPLEADTVRLAQVVGNLLTNAAKYTERGGRIWLTAERHGSAVALGVRDTGIGIAPDMLPRIFELFVQVDHASARSQGGLGIGLTLVRNLVEMHDGTIEARSEGLGKGSEFVVRLPLSATEAVGVGGEGDDERPELESSSGRRLLVVDDNQDAAESLATMLRLQGHEVFVAYDGAGALAMAKGCRPEIVLLDIGMPEMDGCEVARRLRRLPGLENVRLAAVTGWGQQEDRRRTAEAGFDHHLVKPVEPKALEGLLADMRLPSEKR